MLGRSRRRARRRARAGGRPAGARARRAHRIAAPARSRRRVAGGQRAVLHRQRARAGSPVDGLVRRGRRRRRGRPVSVVAVDPHRRRRGARRSVERFADRRRADGGAIAVECRRGRGGVPSPAGRHDPDADRPQRRRVAGGGRVRRRPPGDGYVVGWRTVEASRRLAAAGYDVVVSPGQAYYLDMAVDDVWTTPGASWAGSTSLDDVCEFDPAAGWSDGEMAHLLGVQACLWTEHVHDEAALHRSLFPRLDAVAERAWTGSIVGGARVARAPIGSAQGVTLGPLDRSISARIRFPNPHAEVRRLSRRVSRRRRVRLRQRRSRTRAPG